MRDNLGIEIVGLLLKHQQQYKDSNERIYTNPYLIREVCEVLENSGYGFSKDQKDLVDDWVNGCWEM